MIFYDSRGSALFGDTNIRFFLTDRFGVISDGTFASLNLGNRADKHVDSNIQLLKQTLGITKLHYLQQIHSSNIIRLDSCSHEFLGQGDGIISSLPNHYGMVVVADCNPILLYSQKANTFALLHAGRVGLERDIITKAICAMNCNDLIAFVGTSIRKCCYEINGILLETYLRDYACYVEQRDGKHYLDMIAMIQDVLCTHGIKSEILPHCSCCDERFYSYRRQKECGRFALIAGIAN